MSRKNQWEPPDDFEQLCLKALLLHGPVPAKGWRKLGDSLSIYPTGREASKFRDNVLEFFWDVVWERYDGAEWSNHFKGNLARHYTNLFMTWVREHQQGGENESEPESS